MSFNLGGFNGSSLITPTPFPSPTAVQSVSSSLGVFDLGGVNASASSTAFSEPLSSLLTGSASSRSSLGGFNLGGVNGSSTSSSPSASAGSSSTSSSASLTSAAPSINLLIVFHPGSAINPAANGGTGSGAHRHVLKLL
ncbi:hypothetical protein DFH07DRAFT_969959 [Mycena maculata]|uniref:Uncharacterized protein n=1 Tax=Mycena maculata TaxID=230809 RepID=A0AAD7HVA9_9AGAR|nr:hypothetical protein DFH07DRAFT_969959 [Mycena maculata]